MGKVRVEVLLVGSLLLCLCLAIGVNGKTADVVLPDYHNYTQLVAELEQLADSYTTTSQLYIQGSTVEGRQLAVIRISGEVQQERKLLKPMVKLIANMHGNEPVGRELMLALARYLLQNNGRDPRVSRIVQELDIHILPSLNPDGFENATKGVCSGYHLGTGRHNGHLVDLNRAFPSWDNLTLSQEELTAEAEPEVAAIIDWVFSQPFVLSANFHDGAVVANYPWDDSNGRDGMQSLTPDDQTFRALASLYATRHKSMFKGSGLCHEDNFPGGITNGAEWYIVKGGMQDFNYLFSNCMEMTIELSCCKYPLETELQGHWEDNKESLLSYLEAALGGLRGLVTDKTGTAVQGAVVTVFGLEEKNVTTSFVGEWWRLLAPGRYCVRALDPHLGTPSAWRSVTVEAIDSRVHQRVDLVLGEEGGLPPECQRSTQSPLQSEEGGGGGESSSVGRPVLALALFFASTALLFL